MASPFDRFNNLRSFRSHIRHRPDKLGIVCGSGGGDNSYDCYDWQGSTFTTDNHAAKHKIGPNTYQGTSDNIKNVVTSSFSTVMKAAMENELVIFCSRTEDPLNGTLWDRRATNGQGKAFMGPTPSDIHTANDDAEKVFCGVSNCDDDSIINLLAFSIRGAGYHIDHADLCSVRIKPIISDMCGYENVGMGSNDIGKDQAVLVNPQGKPDTAEPKWTALAFASGVYDEDNAAYTDSHKHPTTVQCIDGNVGKPGRGGDSFPDGQTGHGWTAGSCDNGPGPSQLCSMNDMLSAAGDNFFYQGVSYSGITKGQGKWTTIDSFNEVKHALFQSRWDSFDPSTTVGSEGCAETGQWKPSLPASDARRSDYKGTKCMYLNGALSESTSADGISPCNWASVGNAHPFLNGLSPSFYNPYNLQNAAVNETLKFKEQGVCNTLRQAFRVLNAQNNGMIIKKQFILQGSMGVKAEHGLVDQDLKAISKNFANDGNAIMTLLPAIKDGLYEMQGKTAGLGVTCTELRWEQGNGEVATSCLMSDTLESKLYNGSVTTSNVGNQIPATSQSQFAKYVTKSRGTNTLDSNPTWKDDHANYVNSQTKAAKQEFAALNDVALDEYAKLLLENNNQFFADILGISNDVAKDLLTLSAYLTDRKDSVSALIFGKADRQSHLTNIQEQMAEVDDDAIRDKLSSTILRHYKAIVA